MTPDAWDEYDGPRFEKLRHNRKYHGHGKTHNPQHGMTGATKVGLLKVVELVSSEQRKARKQAKRAEAIEQEARALRRKARRKAREEHGG